MRPAVAVLALALLTTGHSPVHNTVVSGGWLVDRDTETMRVEGLQLPAEIRIDHWGVPHLYAGSEEDLFFVQGFNAARDRLFQIDLWRRRGLGQLAEVFGPAFVDQDKAARLFLYRGNMDREWRAYSSEGSREAEHIALRFVAGINAYVDWLATHPERLPWEFKQLGYRPAKWAPEDVVRIRSHGLTRNLLSEVARANTLCKTKSVDVDQVRLGLSNNWRTQVSENLDPCLPPDILRVFQLATQSVRLTPESIKSGAAKPTEVAALPREEPASEGSNNWVVAARKSTTGRAIMANDPHRAYSVPSLRYIVHLSAPGINLIGAGEPALPGVSIGHNGTIAFGLTIFSIDQEDLYAYELNPSDIAQYRYKGGWEPFRVLKEEIRVKGHASQTAELTFTRHGPVIYVDAEKRRAYAVHSCWLESGTSPYFCSVDSMRTKDFQAFQRAMLNWGAPTVNQVYADTNGNIGWLAVGLAPKRPNWDGLLPVPGDGRNEWAGFWRGDELPRSYNPPEGWIATANAYNIPATYPAEERKLGFEWTNPSRHQRIHEVLGGLNRISLEDCERLQNDVVSIPAQRLVALLGSIHTENDKAKRALELMQGWDGSEQGESAQAALFEVWQARHLRKGFREAALPPGWAAALSTTDMDVMLAGLEQPTARWGEDAREKRKRLMVTTLAGAYAEMEKLQGSDPKSWQWGKLHHNLIEHPFAGVVDRAMDRKINIGPLPKGGSEFTPNASGYRADDFRQTSGPSFRIILDVGNWDNSRAMNYPGQSGDPDSPHYRDLVTLWREGRYFPLLYSRKPIERATERIIRLVPNPK
jgi:penicillin amidase